MKFLQPCIVVISTLCFLTSIHGADTNWNGLDLRWIDKKPIVHIKSGQRTFGYHQFCSLVFNEYVSSEIENSKKSTSRFDSLPNDLVKEVFSKCSKEDRYALRQVNRNLSKRLCIFFDGRESAEGNMWGPDFCLKTNKEQLLSIQQFIRGFLYTMVPQRNLRTPIIYNLLYIKRYEAPTLVDSDAAELCESMAAGRLLLGGTIYARWYSDEGFEILARSLKHQKRICLQFSQFGNDIPQDSLKFLLNTLAEGSQVQDLYVSAMSMTDTMEPYLVNFLSQNKTLKKLTLTCTTLTDEGIKILAQYIAQNEQLKELNFDFSQNMTPIGRDYLEKAFFKDSPITHTPYVAQKWNNILISNITNEPAKERKLYVRRELPNKPTITYIEY